MVLKTPDGRTVLRHMTKKPTPSELRANSVCCLYPLNTPSGEPTVNFAPSDHRHHRGVFPTWYTMEGKKAADFWDADKSALTKDRVIEPHADQRREAQPSGLWRPLHQGSENPDFLKNTWLRTPMNTSRTKDIVQSDRAEAGSRRDFLKRSIAAGTVLAFPVSTGRPDALPEDQGAMRESKPVSIRGRWPTELSAKWIPGQLGIDPRTR